MSTIVDEQEVWRVLKTTEKRENGEANFIVSAILNLSYHIKRKQ